jgi:hypothetical protein
MQDNCILIEDKIDESLKPMETQEMAGNSKVEASLDNHIDLGDQEKNEIAEPITAVIRACSETLENSSMPG